MQSLRSYKLGIVLSLPAILATLLIALSPLLQLLHLSGCSCDHSHFSCDSAEEEHSSSDLACQKKCACKPETDLPHKHHHHDSRSCPICQMYATLHSGISLSQTVKLPCAANHPEVALRTHVSIFVLENIISFSPRAPPPAA